MTHDRDHIVIHFATPVEVAKVKTEAGYCGGALLLVGLMIGLIIGLVLG